MTTISPLMGVLDPLAVSSGAAPTTANASSGTANTGSAGASGAPAGTTTLSANQVNQLANPQLFLKLLVAELQNQDPTAPMDPATILSQTANLSQMEAVTSMTAAIQSEQSASQANEATTLIGQTITATVNNSPVTGTVSQVQLNSSGQPSLLVNGTVVPLSALTAIGTPATGSTSNSSGTSTPASGTPGA